MGKAIQPLTTKSKTNFVRKVLADITPEVTSFAGGLPSPDLLKTKIIPPLREVLGNATDDQMTVWANYGASQGENALVEKIAQIESEKSGMEINPSNVAITVGSQHGMDIAFNAFAGNGAIVGMPTYLGIMEQLRQYANGKIFPVKVDRKGMDVHQVNGILKENPTVKLVYNIPKGHNPAGVRLSDKRADMFPEVTRSNDAVLIEDDPYGGTAKNPSKPIYSRDPQGLGSTIYLSSTSKQLFVARLGWIVAHEDHIDHLTPEISKSVLHVPKFMQYMTLGLIHDLEQTFGTYAEYLKQVVAEFYQTKREQFGRALDEHLGPLEGVTWNMPSEGLFYWVEFPEGTDTEELYDIARDQFRVVFVPGIAFDPLTVLGIEKYKSPIANCGRFNFSMPTEQEMHGGLENIAKAYDIMQNQ